MKVLIAVTHLLGTGHLSRALTLGDAFRRAGHVVQVVSGGMPAPQLDARGLTLLPLPPLRSDGTDFTTLLTSRGTPADAAYLQSRIDMLIDALVTFAPDIVVTELYPFGRRALSAEFEALLESAQELAPRPLILGSIRDILAPPSKPSKVTRTEAQIARFYDGVLVHSDPRITPLEVSWPVSAALAARLHYTGFVAPTGPKPHPEGLGAGEIIVSAGGGPVGQPIFHAAIEAARLTPDRQWRLLVGGRDAASRIVQLQELAAGAPVLVEPARPDFRQMLTHAAASVSMCGYNTAMDILQAGTPAVFVPFDDGKEVEQGLRAQSLSHLTGIKIRASAELTGKILAEAVAAVMADTPRTGLDVSFDGADRAVGIARELWEARR